MFKIYFLWNFEAKFDAYRTLACVYENNTTY